MIRKKDGSNVEASWTEFTLERVEGKRWHVKLNNDGSTGFIVWKEELVAEKTEKELLSNNVDEINLDDLYASLDELFSGENKESDKRSGLQRLFEDFNKPHNTE